MKPRSSVLLTLLGSGQLALSFISPHPKAIAHRQPKSSLQYYRGDSHGFSTVGSGGDYNLHQVSTLRGSGNTRNNSDYGSLSSLSVSELKRLLNDRGVDYRDCLEKRDLVERILSSSNHRRGEYHSDRNAGGSGLSQEENRVVNTFARASPSVAYIQTMSPPVIPRGFSLKGTEVPTGAGSGFLWDEKVRFSCSLHLPNLFIETISYIS